MKPFAHGTEHLEQKSFNYQLSKVVVLNFV